MAQKAKGKKRSRARQTFSGDRVGPGSRGLTGLTPEIMRKLEEGLRIGMPRRDAYIRADIPHSTFFYWIDRAKAAREAKKSNSFTALLDAVEKAEADSLFNSLLRVKAAQRNWQAHAWFLERKRPEEFGRPYRIEKPPEGSGGGVQVIRVPVKSGSVEEWTVAFSASGSKGRQEPG